MALSAESRKRVVNNAEWASDPIRGIEGAKRELQRALEDARAWRALAIARFHAGCFAAFETIENGRRESQETQTLNL